MALLAYNQGIGGTEGFKGNPLDTDYVSGVKSNIPMYDERAIKPNLLTKMLTSTGVASTNDNIVKKEPFNKDLKIFFKFNSFNAFIRQIYSLIHIRVKKNLV